MSVRISTWVWQHSGAAGNDLLILLALADQANDNGLCWPSAQYIADKTRLSRRTVQRRIAELAGEGKVINFSSGQKRGASNVYQFAIEDPSPVQPEVRQADVRQFEGTTPNDAGGETSTVAPGTTPSDARTVIEPSVNRQGPKRARAIPKDFTVTPDMAVWARSNTPTVDIACETQQFIDHHTAKGSTFKDGVAAWRTWMRNSAKFQASRSGREPSGRGIWGVS